MNTKKNMIPIPNYLEKFTTDESWGKDAVTFSIQCDCGCRRFEVYQSTYTAEEKQEVDEYSALLVKRWMDSEAGMEDVLRTGTQPPGMKEEIVLPPAPFYMSITVVKATCSSCGNELVLFDSRYHGYDGVTTETDSRTRDYRPRYKRKCRQPVEISIKVRNEISFSEFIDGTMPDFDETDYSNAFDWISIYKLDIDGKKHRLFDFETA